jgi:hypothetical protein
VIAIDHLDSVPPSRGREILRSAHALFKQGYVTVLAACPADLLGAEAVGTPGLQRWLDVPFQLGEITARADCPAFVRNILGSRETQDAPPRDARTSMLDRPLSAAETRLIVSLATLAGNSPRGLRRFVNLYRLARAQDHEHLGALAFMLAVHAGGTPSEVAALDEALIGADPAAELNLDRCGTRVNDAFGLVGLMLGKASVTAARQAAATARTFSFKTE